MISCDADCLQVIRENKIGLAYLGGGWGVMDPLYHKEVDLKVYPDILDAVTAFLEWKANGGGKKRRGYVRGG